MNNEIVILCAAAATIGFGHTITGPDHYLPFIAMSKARNWNLTKTLFITILCGIGHVLGSIVLGFVGIAMGVLVDKLQFFEEIRGNIAAYLLIGFGLIYCIWGIYKAIRNKPHIHIHSHADETVHRHEHVHEKGHAHAHPHKKKNITPWILFTIFIFGPCEPLIPFLMYPAAKENIAGVIVVALVFSVVTIATMTGITIFSVFGLSLLKKLKLERFERYTHAIAGGTIFLSGMAIQFLGL